MGSIVFIHGVTRLSGVTTTSVQHGVQTQWRFLLVGSRRAAASAYAAPAGPSAQVSSHSLREPHQNIGAENAYTGHAAAAPRAVHLSHPMQTQGLARYTVCESTPLLAQRCHGLFAELKSGVASHCSA